MAGRVLSIHVAEREGGALRPLETAELVAGFGIRGDRYFADGPDNEAAVTLVAAEQVAHVNRTLGLEIEAPQTRRNVVTSGIDLNAYVGRRVYLGGAVIEGMELCEPCRTLGDALAGARTCAEIVRAFTHRAGLRARIVSSGTVAVGDLVG